MRICELLFYRKVLFYGITFLLAQITVAVQPLFANDKPKIAIIQQLLAQPERQIDLARAKVTIDKLVDPSIDVEGTLARLDGMVKSIEAFAGPNASADQKIAAIRTYIYRAGPWNDGKVFSYNLKDPLGTYIPSKLLANYLDIIQIRAPDAVVEAFGNAARGNADYDLVPNVSDGANSNSAAAAIARGAARFAGNGQLVTSPFVTPGVSQANRVEFNEAQLKEDLKTCVQNEGC